jgi:hypothetical protein
MTSSFNLPCGCTASDISSPEPLECEECGEWYYGERPLEIGDVVRCEECERKESEWTE